MTWEEMVKLAPHYKAVGLTELSLHRHDDPKPWEYVTSIEPGGMVRNGVNVSLHVKAVHPSGLTFTWFFELEPRDANGKSGYSIDTATLRAMLNRLKPGVRANLASFLKDAAVKIRKQADEYASFVGEQMSQAHQMAALAAETELK